MNSSVQTYDLNQGQLEAAEEFFQFLFTDEKEFKLSGPAGVGKTYWMGYIIDIIMPRYHEMCKLMGITADYNDVVMTATTNKAAEVLANQTGRPTQTIHSYLGLKVFEDFSSGKTTITRSTAWTMKQAKIIFIDEASMIDKSLKEEILVSTLKCKIIYVGDKYQLAPVGENVSSVYVHNTPIYNLTEQMRTSIPELQAINAQLRETVENEIFKPIQIVPGIIDYLDGPTMEATITEYFHNQTLNARILAYTNKRVLEYNGHIRSIRQLPDSYQPGEFLVNNSAVKIKSRMITVEANIEIIANKGPDIIKIENDVELHVDRLDFKTSMGEYFTDIPVPTDMDHFNKLIKYYSRNKNWERMFFLKSGFPDLRQRDAATVHKSQGSTYETVFIDLGNISTCNFQSQVTRMLYVAFSRARSRVFLYGDLADKYGGLIAP